MKNPVIVSAVRTAVGSFGGTLKGVSVVKLGAHVIREALNRAGLRPEVSQAQALAEMRALARGQSGCARIGTVPSAGEGIDRFGESK